jgi:16S rRNA G966 N2-methylase RsmD
MKRIGGQAIWKERLIHLYKFLYIDPPWKKNHWGESLVQAGHELWNMWTAISFISGDKGKSSRRIEGWVFPRIDADTTALKYVLDFM